MITGNNFDSEMLKEFDLKGSIRSLYRKRAVHRHKVSVYLKKLRQLDYENKCNSLYCRNQVSEVEAKMSHVKEYGERINKVMEQHGLSLHLIHQ